MANMSVITDDKGAMLAAVRTDSFKTTDGKELEFHPNPKYKHQIVDVDDKMLRGPASELGTFLRSKIK